MWNCLQSSTGKSQSLQWPLKWSWVKTKEANCNNLNVLFSESKALRKGGRHHSAKFFLSLHWFLRTSLPEQFVKMLAFFFFPCFLHYLSYHTVSVWVEGRVTWRIIHLRSRERLFLLYRQRIMDLFPYFFKALSTSFPIVHSWLHGELPGPPRAPSPPPQPPPSGIKLSCMLAACTYHNWCEEKKDSDVDYRNTRLVYTHKEAKK